LKLSLTKENFISIHFNTFTVDHTINKLTVENDFILNTLFKTLGLYKSIINKTLQKIILQKLNLIEKNINSSLQKEIHLPFLNSTFEIKMQNPIIYSNTNFEVDLILATNDNDESKEFLKMPITKNQNLTDITDEVQISIDSTLINQVLALALQNNRTFKISNDLLPPDSPFKINTVYFQGLLPKLYELYPNKDLIITLDLESFPTVAFNQTDESIEVDLNLAVSFQIKDDPETTILAISTSDTVKVVMDTSKEDSSIHIQIQEIIVNDIAEIYSSIGEVDPQEFKKSINEFFSSLIYFVNNFLRVNPIKISVIDGLKFEYINISVDDQNLFKIICKPDYSYKLNKFDWIIKK